MVPKDYGSDIETTGLDPFRDQIIGIAFSWAPGEAVHFDWPSPEALILLEYPCTFHNGTFDCTFLYANGVKNINYADDTRWMQHIIAPDMPKDLSFISSVHSPYNRWKEHDDKDTVTGTTSKKIALATTTLPKHLVRELCCKDADATRIDAQALKVEMKLEGVDKPYREIMMPLARTCVDVRVRGVRIDVRAAGRAYRESIAALKTIERVFHSRGWNPRSPIQMKSILNQAGLKCKSTGKEVLDALWKRNVGHPLLAAIRAHREGDTDRKLYKGILSRMYQDRIHTDYDPSGTDTGRLASKNPNLMNVAKRYRDIFIPDEGMGFMSGDYTGIELKVAAARSHDKKMIEDVWDRDIHSEYRMRAYGRDDVSDAEKLRAKAIVFGGIYLRSARSIAQEWAISVQEGQRLIDALFEPYPQFKAQCQEDVKRAQKDGELRSPFGRVRHFYGGNVPSKAVNFPTQSGAADITFKSFNRLNDECKSLDGDVMLENHDEVVLQYPLGEERTYYELMKDIMEQPIPELDNLVFPVKIKIGPNWRDLEGYNG